MSDENAEVQPPSKPAAQAEHDDEGTTATPPEDAAPGGEAQAGDDSPDSDGADPPPDKPRGGFQKRIDDLTRRLREAERREERLLALAENQVGAPQAQTAAPPEDPEPKRESFDDYETYLAQTARWNVRQESRAVQAAAEAAARKRESESQDRARAQTWETRLAAARADDTDFDGYLDAVGTSVSQDIAIGIQESEEGPAVVAYLGKHPDELAQVGTKTGRAAAIAIGRIEERIAQERTRQKPRSATPAPIDPVRSGGAPATAEPSDRDSTEVWMRKRNEEIAAQRKASARR